MNGTSTRIFFPPTLTFQTLGVFSRALRASGTQAIEIDFEHTRWTPPFMLLQAASEINRFRKDYPSVTLRCSNFERQTYAAHMGFFWSFGLPHGNRPGEATGNSNYQPLTIISCEQVRDDAIRNGMAIGAVMEEHATVLAGVLCRSVAGPLFDVLAYSLREIMRNVVEHSESDRVAFCAQYWPTRRRVEVGINDWGIGIMASLQKNPDLQVASDAEAIHLALMPGISGRGAIVKRLKRRNEWTNSGYGLYMTSRVARKGGTFVIGSGSTATMLSGEDAYPVHWEYPGTAVRMELFTDQIDDLPTMLDTFRREADLFRKSTAGTRPLPPSIASQALARNFRSR